MTPDHIRDELSLLRDEAAILLEAYLARPLLRGLSHLIGCATALVAVVVLALQAAAGLQLVASLIYGAGLTLTLGTSALFHRVRWTPRWHRRIRALDHSMIYVLIASSCTPFALLMLDGPWRVVMLGGIWLLACGGVLVRLLNAHQPRWLQVGTYLGMGWVGLALAPAIHEQSASMFMLLVVGGVLYTIGGIVYLAQRPDPLPRVFGFHEVFHALVIAAATCHYLAVWPLVSGNLSV